METVLNSNTYDVLVYYIFLTHTITTLQAAEFVCHDKPVNLGVSHLWHEQSLMCNEFLVSDDGNAVAHMHPDGELKFYDRAGNEYFKSSMNTGFGTLLLVLGHKPFKGFQYGLVNFGQTISSVWCTPANLFFSATVGLLSQANCNGYRIQWRVDATATNPWPVNTFIEVSANPIPDVYRNPILQKLCLMTAEKYDAVADIAYMHWYYDGRCIVARGGTGVNRNDADASCRNGLSFFSGTISSGRVSSHWNPTKQAYVMWKITSTYWAYTEGYNGTKRNGWTSAQRTSTGLTPEDGWTWEDGSSVDSSLFESTDMSKPLNACAIIRARTGGLVETPCDSVDAFNICEYDMLEYYCRLATNLTTRPMNTQLRYKGTPRREFTELVVEETNGVCEQMCQLRCTQRRDCGSLTFIPPVTCRLHRVHNDTEGLCFHTIPHANAIYYTIAG